MTRPRKLGLRSVQRAIAGWNPDVLGEDALIFEMREQVRQCPSLRFAGCDDNHVFVHSVGPEPLALVELPERKPRGIQGGPYTPGVGRFVNRRAFLLPSHHSYGGRFI